MTNASKLKDLARGAGIALARNLHGGLLVVVLLAVAFLAGRMGLSLPSTGSQQVSGLIGDVQPIQAAALSDEARGRLAPDMRGVVDYLSRKYRVAAPAVEPLINASRAAGQRLGLDPMLILAVIAIESGFNPIAESPLGAQGLMQIIPRFHQDKVEEGAGPDALLDPQMNIQVGARVLKESIRRAGSTVGGLQQYAGVSDDDDTEYADKVLAEKQRLDAALRRGKPSGA